MNLNPEVIDATHATIKATQIMDQQTLINLLLGAIGAGISWWVNSVWAMAKSQQKDISSLHIKLAENYVPRAELEGRLTRIQDRLDEVLEIVRRNP
jgi:predicted GTPase